MPSAAGQAGVCAGGLQAVREMVMAQRARGLRPGLCHLSVMLLSPSRLTSYIFEPQLLHL